MLKVLENYPEYAVTPVGEVVSLVFRGRNTVRPQHRILTPVEGHNGYKTVCIVSNGKKYVRRVHRLVMEAFHRPSHLEVNHINGIKSDNSLENLEYVTHQQNVAHAVKTGLTNHKGQLNPSSKLSDSQTLEIKQLLENSRTSQKDLASRFGISQQTINRIKKVLIK
jgi:DNA-binding transcriptional regulator YiaG